jgi:hypothetical protein
MVQGDRREQMTFLRLIQPVHCDIIAIVYMVRTVAYGIASGFSGAVIGLFFSVALNTADLRMVVFSGIICFLMGTIAAFGVNRIESRRTPFSFLRRRDAEALSVVAEHIFREALLPRAMRDRMVTRIRSFLERWL